MINLDEGYSNPQKTANDYVHGVYDSLKKRNPDETEFLQATREIFESLRPVFIKRTDFIRDGILERITEPGANYYISGCLGRRQGESSR